MGLGISGNQGLERYRRQMASSASAGDKVEVGGKSYQLGSTKVERGDSLTELVQKANPGVKDKELNALVQKARDLNNLPSEHAIQAGQSLLIPKAEQQQAAKGAEESRQAGPFDGASTYVETAPSGQAQSTRAKGKQADRNKFGDQRRANQSKRRTLEGAKADAAQGSSSTQQARIGAVEKAGGPEPGAALTEADRSRIAGEARHLLQLAGVPASGPITAANQLAEKLQGMTGNEQNELLKQLAQKSPAGAATILGVGAKSGVGHKVDGESRDAIAQAFGRAYDSGAISQAQMNQMMSPETMKQPPYLDPTLLASTIARSGSERLQTDASARALQIAESTTDGRGKVAFSAAAAEAASGSSAAANHLLSQLGTGEKLDHFLEAARPSAAQPPRTEGSQRALGHLAQAMSGIQPPNANTDAFFDKAVGVVDGDAGMRQGLGRYFQSNMSAITDRLSTADTTAAQSTMTQFSKNVLFSDPFHGQDELRASFSKHIGERVAELQGVSGTHDPAAEQKARQLGFLIGGTSNGIQRALGEVRDENAARKAMVDMVFDLASPISLDHVPDVSIPGIGSVKGQLVGGLKEQLYEQVTKAEPDPRAMTKPLYDLGASIPADYRDEYKSYVSGAYVEESSGWLDR
jgi:hypothetical protein